MNSNFLSVNISADDVIAQNEQEKEKVFVKKQQTSFDKKNYLQARLNDNEKSKTLVIRLLPFSPEGGSPFQKVFMHQVRVNKEVSSGGWKTFVCPIHNKLGDSCPFCATSEQARKFKNQTTDKIQREKFGNIEFLNKVKEMWIVRCIERGYEEDGVKFWLFNHKKTNDGVYDKIINIFHTRANSAKAMGKVNNIFDLNQGKDLALNLTKDSNKRTVINVVDDDEKTPLSNDYELALSWINDAKKWTEVYTVKTQEFMSIIIEGGVPVYDKEKKCYVDKEVFLVDEKIAKENEINENLTHETKDFSTIKEEDELNGVISNEEIEDDLPF